jgi:ribosomal protein S18 acetylase RimI-like enzyme
MVQIRRATPADASAIAKVLLEAFAEHEDLYTAKSFAATTITSNDVRDRLEEGPVWLATARGEAVGTVSAVRRFDEVYLRGMAVVPYARGQGIGWRLLEHVSEFATASGCRRLILSTTPFLARAIQLYESYGFVRTIEGPSELFGTPLFTMIKPLSTARTE